MMSEQSPTIDLLTFQRILQSHSCVAIVCVCADKVPKLLQLIIDVPEVLFFLYNE
jgi:hypothetical protein